MDIMKYMGLPNIKRVDKSSIPSAIIQAINPNENKYLNVMLSIGLIFILQVCLS